MTSKCECGKHYETQKGVDLCKANRHGTYLINFNHNFQPRQSFDIDVEVYCAECGVRIMSQLSRGLGNVAVKVMPHICAVPEPEPEPEVEIQGDSHDLT